MLLVASMILRANQVGVTLSRFIEMSLAWMELPWSTRPQSFRVTWVQPPRSARAIYALPVWTAGTIIRPRPVRLLLFIPYILGLFVILLVSTDLSLSWLTLTRYGNSGIQVSSTIAFIEYIVFDDGLLLLILLVVLQWLQSWKLTGITITIVHHLIVFSELLTQLFLELLLHFHLQLLDIEDLGLAVVV